ncbi:MAG TPA: DUF5063 domain-containing protein [Bacteroidales bacterium]|jgi:hypothetical protein|nr:DUF5063 domain-containing protein [Bacteroidales bacterium]
MEENRQATDFDRQVVEMLTLATEYFRFLESLENVSKTDFQQFILKMSALLYVKGLMFPETEQPDESGNERFVTEEEWENIFNAIRAKLEMDDNFADIESPENEEIIKASLAELLADVYQDMKDFALLLTKPTQTAYDNAVYGIKQLFKSHWGIRLLTVQKVLHSRVYPEPGSNIEIDW